MTSSIGMQSMLALNMPTEISLVLLITLEIKPFLYYCKNVFFMNS